MGFLKKISRRPRLIHPLDLLPNGTLMIQFSLKLVGSLGPLGLLFEQLNPGFKMYLGDALLFDYGRNGRADEVRYPS
jgi:hypothetical protein